MNGDRQDGGADDTNEFEESTFSRYLLPIGLFCLTIFTTLWAGAYQDHPNRFHPFRGAWELLTERPGELVNGIPFAGTLLLILVTHEFAHYVYSKRHGVPARVVTGYLGGEYNALGEYLIVRQSDAHAWAEAWLQDRGWVRIDPTLAVAPERIELSVSDLLRSRNRLLADSPPAHKKLFESLAHIN